MSEQGPAVQLRRLVNGYQVSQAIHAVATLGIADLLKDGPRSSDELASTTDTHPQSLYRLLRALAAVGIFQEDEDCRFSLTKLGDGLRSDSPNPIAPWAVNIGQPSHWQTWGNLLLSIRTGKNAFRELYDTDVWSYRSQHPEEGIIFDRAMTGISKSVGEAVVKAYDFRSFGVVVDIAGGQGALLAKVLASHPSGRGILFDQPHVIANTGEVLRAAGVADRCETVAGDFFKSVPAGGDAYMLKWIIHDWEDAESIAILRNCRRAMGSSARLLLVEHVLEPPNQGAAAKFMDLNMLVLPGGKERTRDEFAALFAEAGFRLTRIVPTETPFGVIEGVPV